MKKTSMKKTSVGENGSIGRHEAKRRTIGRMVYLMTGFFLMTVLVAGCNRIDWDEFFRERDVPRKFKIKEFVRNYQNNYPRTYSFTYNAKGDVTVVHAQDQSVGYEYRVVYEGWRIDSVYLINNGVIESVHRDFVYDDKKRIVQFRYYLRLYPDFQPNVFDITYDGQGRMNSFSGNTYAYNEDDDMIQSNDMTFSYDDKLNPLYFVDNIWAIFVEETWIRELSLSKHNSTIVQYPGNPGSQVGYHNEYDDWNRLTRKVMYSSNGQQDEFRFTYLE